MVPTKGERTRERIVATAAPVFNRLGFAGTSMADLMAAAGLEKGGIYRHFESKDELALAAFDHALALHAERIRTFVGRADGARARLVALAEGLASLLEDPVVAGGCPLLNTAVESDSAQGHAYRALRARTRRALRRLIDYARHVIERGVADGELAPDVDAEAAASVIVATMEGAMMLASLYGDASYLRHAVRHVAAHAEMLSARPGDGSG